jgi:hypothetical protein
MVSHIRGERSDAEAGNRGAGAVGQKPKRTKDRSDGRASTFVCCSSCRSIFSFLRLKVVSSRYATEDWLLNRVKFHLPAILPFSLFLTVHTDIPPFSISHPYQLVHVSLRLDTRETITTGVISLSSLLLSLLPEDLFSSSSLAESLFSLSTTSKMSGASLTVESWGGCGTWVCGMGLFGGGGIGEDSHNAGVTEASLLAISLFLPEEIFKR